MENFFRKLKVIATDRALRNRIFFVLGALLVFRMLAAIPIPGVDTIRLAQFLSNNQFFGILNIFSGGGLSNLSIIMLGVGPYITSSIVMQLLTMMFPSLKSMYQEEGDAGRAKFTNYTRWLTVLFAAIQGYSLLILLERQGALFPLDMAGRLENLLIIVSGSILLMWIGELVSEFGIGNGVSLLIFAGIVANLPTEISQLLFSYDPSQLPYFIMFGAIGLLLIAGIVYMTEAERPIPVTYAKQMRGMKTTSGGGSTYIPLRLTQAGVIPIIFALSILTFPQIFVNLFATSTNLTLVSISQALSSFLQKGFAYGATYFVLVFVFTYLYTAITFDPKTMSENLQKNGAFIPGIRPGQATAHYVGHVLVRITLVGALFLGIIAVLPLAMKSLTGITAIALGGTALLIVINVVTDLIKKIDAQVSMREY